MNALLFRRWFGRPQLPVPETLENRATRGDADAQFNLGLQFASGKGFALDYARAVYWYLKAAEQSHAQAQFNLGMIYGQGQGMPSDKAESILRIIDRAAYLGNPAAQYTLGIACHRASLGWSPENASESRIEAYKWLQLADNQGYRNSDIAWALVTLQMTDEEVADGNHRVAAFVVTQPDPTPCALVSEAT